MCSRPKHAGKVLVLEQIKTSFKTRVIKKNIKKTIIIICKNKKIFGALWCLVGLCNLEPLLLCFEFVFAGFWSFLLGASFSVSQPNCTWFARMYFSANFVSSFFVWLLCLVAARGKKVKKTANWAAYSQKAAWVKLFARV